MDKTINQIDHIGIAHSDIFKNENNYKNIGFNLTKLEPLISIDSKNNPIELGQHSQHFIFEKSYVELTGVIDSNKGSHISSFIEKFDGLHILCFNTSNASESATKLRKIGINVGKIQTASRIVNYGKKGIAKFKWFIIPKSIAPEGLICFVEHLTPELVFQEKIFSHKNLANSLIEVKIYSENLIQSCDNYSKILDMNYISHSLGYQFNFSENNLIILNYDSYKSEYPSEEPPSKSCLASFSVGVSDIAKTRNYLISKNINFINRNSQCSWVPSKVGGGAIIDFHQKKF